MAVIGSAYIAIRPDTSNFKKETEKGVLSSAQDLAKKVGLVIGAAFVAKKTFDFFKAGIAGARDLNEEISKSNVVFGSAAGAVDQFANGSVKGLGLSKAAALQATGTFGNLFRTVGLGNDVSAQYSTTLTQLAADLSSFNNTSLEQALNAIQSGLVGETRPLRQFGINLDEASLKAKALALGLDDGKGVLNASARAQAAYALILEQSTLAQGDFARTSGGLANSQRILSARFQQLQQQVGSLLLPAVLAITQAFTNQLIPAIERTVQIVAAVLGPVLRTVTDHAAGLRQILIGVAAALTVAAIPALVAFTRQLLAAVAVKVFFFLANLGAGLYTVAVNLGLVTAATVETRASLTTLGASVGAVGLAVAVLGGLFAKNAADHAKWKAELQTATTEQLQAELAALQKQLDDLTDASFVDSFLGTVFSWEGTGAQADDLRKKIAAVNQALSDGIAKQNAAAESEAKKKQADLDAAAASRSFTAQQEAYNVALAKFLDISLSATEHAAAYKDLIENTVGTVLHNTEVTSAYNKALKGVADAFTVTRDQARAAEDAQTRVTAADQDLIAKRRVLADLISKSVVDQKALTQAQRDYRSSVLAVVDATRSRAEAERALFEILHPSQRTQQDASLRVQEANNSVARSALAVTAAETRLAQVRADTTSTADDIRAAELDLSDAHLAAIRATEGQQDATQALIALTPQAIRSSKEYEDAQRAVTDARRQEIDAQTAAQDSLANLQEVEKGDVNRADEIAAARRDVAAATVEQKRAHEDLTTALESLNPTLDLTTARGQAVYAAFVDAAGAAKDLASNTFDLTHDATVANQVFDDTALLIEQAGIKAGFTKAQIDGLLGTVGFGIKIPVEAPGLEFVQHQLALLNTRLVTVIQTATGVRFITDVSGSPNTTGALIRVGANAEGGIVRNRMLSWLAEEGPELVLPLKDQARMRQLIVQAGIQGLFAQPVTSPTPFVTTAPAGVAVRSVSTGAPTVSVVFERGAFVFYGAPSQTEAETAGDTIGAGIRRALAARRLDVAIRNT